MKNNPIYRGPENGDAASTLVNSDVVFTTREVDRLSRSTPNASNPIRAFGNWRALVAQNKYEADRLTIVRECELRKLSIASQTSIREIQTFCQLQLAVVIESIKCSVQGNLQEIEIRKLEQVMRHLQDAFERAYEQIARIEKGPLSSVAKAKLIERCTLNLEKTVVALEENTVAATYDLA